MCSNKVAIGVLAFLVFVHIRVNEAAAGAPTQTLNDFRVRFSLNPAQGFYELPWNTSSPLINNYVQVPASLGLPVNLYCYPNDPRVCLMFDFNGNIAGMQISYLFQDVQPFSNYYNFSAVGSFTVTNLFNTPSYSLRVYFTNPTTLTTAGRQNLSQMVEGVWVVLNNTLYSMDMVEPPSTLNNIGPFYRQSCFPGMGQHYFFNTNQHVPCTQLTPFFAMYARGILAGFGILEFGLGSTLRGGREWYDQAAPPTPAANDILLPYRPPCFDQYTEAIGLNSVHVYFIDHPWQTTCPA